MKKIFKYIFIATLLVFLGYFSTEFFSFRAAQNEKEETAAVISNEHTTGRVLGEEEETSSRMFASDNFRSPQITFGGDAIAYQSGGQSEAPEILDMRSELLTTKTDQEVKFVLSWKTNKLCKSSIEYVKEGQSDGKTISEDGYGFVHSAEIAPLNYSTSYSYKVSIRDRLGTEFDSDKLAFYTGAPNVSIFDLLGGAFKDMFGWTGKK